MWMQPGIAIPIVSIQWMSNNARKEKMWLKFDAKELNENWMLAQTLRWKRLRRQLRY